MYFLKENPNWKEYEKFLKDICSLSKLFSDSEVPYLYYRAHENLFCKAFDANNLSRDDTSADAKKENIGIGLKTFLNERGNSQQKVAEFNAKRDQYASLKGKDLANLISILRNERIDFTYRNYGLDKLIYHCVTRENGKLKIFEETMDMIDIKNIKVIKSTDKSVSFNDGKHDYNFNFSKSTLLKKFNTTNFVEVPIKILEDPFLAIESIGKNNKLLKMEVQKANWKNKTKIVLPLYSTKNGKVPEKSGLNQWNAGGRKRNFNEIYVPIPTVVHDVSPNFFPERDVQFELQLPNGKILNVKVCQDGDKALMSNPNKDLGQWLLRDIFGLKEGQLLTREKLDRVGVDSVEITKIEEKKYSIDFKHTGMYDNFLDFMINDISLTDEEN